MTNNAALLQLVSPRNLPPGSFVPHLGLTMQRNEAYCARWGFDFLHDVNDLGLDILQGGWPKVRYIQQALALGYERVVWLDADALIADLSMDLREACRDIGACWHRIAQGPHWNVGVLYVENTAPVRSFVDEWMAEYPGKDWREQGVFNQLAMKGNLVHTLSDRWNATYGVNMVPDAIVLGFHGIGDAKMRYDLMAETLKQLPGESALATQGVVCEVTNG